MIQHLVNAPTVNVADVILKPIDFHTKGEEEWGIKDIC